MQNTPQTFRGPGAPGVNFAEHTYDNHIGAAHCQPSGYQPYSNPPYHPIPTPRPHHYANHQMQQQQNMPYRHHGGAYAPSQNQYGQNMNQEMYRNHHSGYVGPSPRNMPNKPPWSENSVENMYGQVSPHPQMMNNSQQQMPVNTMRSPPHATSNMNPAPPPQGQQQHYRQMQSPAHSPHSWSQAQIPSPGVMHSSSQAQIPSPGVMHPSRTTPSPQMAHARSPGHSQQQPFSPPAMGMPPLPPENGQAPAMNPPGGENHNPSNPLHSLQKMVMLDQDPAKVMLPMMGDGGGERFSNQCSFEEGASNESKDSAYSTYYNMDENRFESKPNIAANDTSAYSTIQQVTNCNFPLPSHSMNNDEKNPCAGNGSSVHEALQPDAPLSNSVSAAPPIAQCHPSVTRNDCSLNSAECPPHAESAPAFTDQTEAAVATNSEQALETMSNPTLTGNPPESNELPLADIPNLHNDGAPGSSEENLPSFESLNAGDVLPVVQIKTEHSEENDKLNNNCKLQPLNEDGDCLTIPNNGCESDKSSVDSLESSVSKSDVLCKKELSDVLEDTQEKILNSETIKLIAEVHKSDMDTEGAGSLANLKGENHLDDAKNPALRTQKVEPDCEDLPPEQSSPAKSSTIEDKNSPTKYDYLSTNEDIYDSKPLKDLARNPVKVVIHRIRKDDTNDTWHVPGSSSKEGCQASNVSDCDDKKPESKIPNVGPQIIILSPASSSQKKFGFQSSVAANNVITIDDDITIVETIESPPAGTATSSSRRGRKSPGGASPDKKRGRPVGSKNKMPKPGGSPKKKGRRGGKRKKLELSKAPETPSKPSKRVKIFSGPYVHIVGSKDNPSSIKVVNVAQKEEEKVNKVQPKRSFSHTANRIIKKKPVGHLSTLSPTYDAFNRDKTWLCVFCHKGSHIGGLGDLYGPYYIKDKNPESTKSPSATPSTSSGSGSTRGKRRKSEADDAKSSKRAKHSTSHDSTPRSAASRDDASVDPDAADMREVWIHEDCAVWCQSISLMGEEVQGLEEAIAEARENTCCQCSLNGATLGCWGKSCKEQYHYSCAKDTGCQMDIEKFSLLCPSHQKKSPRSSQ